uniref:Phosphoribulokinase/uridine kinase domain-containing protein n=1 Tax=Neolamprologus brichardi TaxID=32507 RepID=A0A3Q4GGJ2_NEOBR
MAGDSETHLGDRDENTQVVRQPFLIGVSGGTASGKVSVLPSSGSCCQAQTEHNTCYTKAIPGLPNVRGAVPRVWVHIEL